MLPGEVKLMRKRLISKIISSMPRTSPNPNARLSHLAHHSVFRFKGEQGVDSQSDFKPRIYRRGERVG